MTELEQSAQWPPGWASRQNTAQLIAWLDAQFNGQLMMRVGSDEQREIQIRIWAEALGGLTVRQVRHGKSRTMAIAGGGERVPMPAQFRRMCITLPAHEPYQALPAPDVSPGQAERNRAAIRAAAKPANMRRCLYRKGYGRDEHQATLDEVRAAGLPLYVADMRAMACHGWSEALEAAHRRAWMALPGRRLVCADRQPTRLALYLPGHAPPDWVIRTTDYARVDEWIKTGQLPTEDAA